MSGTCVTLWMKMDFWKMANTATISKNMIWECVIQMNIQMKIPELQRLQEMAVLDVPPPHTNIIH